MQVCDCQPHMHIPLFARRATQELVTVAMQRLRGLNRELSRAGLQRILVRQQNADRSFFRLFRAYQSRVIFDLFVQTLHDMRWRAGRLPTLS